MYVNIRNKDIFFCWEMNFKYFIIFIQLEIELFIDI